MVCLMPKGMRPNGLRIAQARLALPDKPSQAEFAKRIGIHWVTQSNIENGKANISLELLERIAEVTGEKREHFLTGASDDDAEAALPELIALSRDESDLLVELMARAIAHRYPQWAVKT